MDKEEECPICFHTTKVESHIVGCSHKFCFECISKWAVMARARCPVCNRKMYDLMGDLGAIYLSPHYEKFGFRYSKSHGGLRVESVDEGGAACRSGIEKGDYLTVNGHSSFKECASCIQEARRMGRMIHVTRVSTSLETDAPSSPPRVQKCCPTHVLGLKLPPW
jgi:uncharacterized repeat protein (TIGR04076 family)